MSSNLSRRAMIAGLAAAAPLAARAQSAPQAGFGHVERLDPALDALLDANAPVEKVLDNFTWSEGPVWVGGADGYLLVSDPRANVIRSWSRTRGPGEWLRPSGYSAGLSPSLSEPGTNGLILGRGGILASDSGNRCVVRIDMKTKARTVLASRFEGKRFNSPNDLVLARDGAIYFTDPPFGLKGGGNSPVRELDFTGVYRLSRQGELTVIDRSVSPNGVGLSPDGRTLYATDRTGWVAWTLDAAGRPAARRLFIGRDVATGGDGFKVDAAGNLWASSRDGISIFNPSGKRLGIIRSDQVISNCVIGADGYLYMASNVRVLRVKAKAKALKVYRGFIGSPVSPV
jgi:gluconolactonase